MENQDFELVFISDSDTDNESDIMSNKKELANYSYISNGLYFEYFVGYEITALLGYKNPAKTINDNISKCNRLEFRDYPGVKEPELDPRTILITRDGAIEILIKTRKRISPDVLHILKRFGIDTTNSKCLTKEQQTLSALTNSFKTEKFEDQFKVGRYYLDLYFPEYKIVVECDENGHADRKPDDERKRMDYVNEKLGLTDDNWIRFNPDAKDFDVSKVIGKIYMRINLLKSVQIQDLLKIQEQTFPQPPQVLMISKLLDIFKEEKVVENYNIKDKYNVKLFFSEYKIIVDEEQDISDDNTLRKCVINDFLKIDDSFWIKYDKNNYDITYIISSIYTLFKNKGKVVYKTCVSCKLSKEISEFHRNKYSSSGFEYRCKCCRSIENKNRLQLRREKLTIIDEKQCLKCDKTSHIDNFWTSINYKDGYHKFCIQCAKEHQKELKEENKKNPDNLKKCSKCENIKPKEEFTKKTESYDELNSMCKACVKTIKAQEYIEKQKKIHRPIEGVLTIFYNEKRMKYYIANEIVKILNYTGRSDTLLERKVSSENKISFINFKGSTENMKIDKRTVLINNDGINELLKSSLVSVILTDETLEKIKKIQEEK